MKLTSSLDGGLLEVDDVTARKYFSVCSAFGDVSNDQDTFPLPYSGAAIRHYIIIAKHGDYRVTVLSCSIGMGSTKNANNIVDDPLTEDSLIEAADLAHYIGAPRAWYDSFTVVLQGGKPTGYGYDWMSIDADLCVTFPITRLVDWLRLLSSTPHLHSQLFLCTSVLDLARNSRDAWANEMSKELWEALYLLIQTVAEARALTYMDALRAVLGYNHELLIKYAQLACLHAPQLQHLLNTDLEGGLQDLLLSIQEPDRAIFYKEIIEHAFAEKKETLCRVAVKILNEQRCDYVGIGAWALQLVRFGWLDILVLLLLGRVNACTTYDSNRLFVKNVLRKFCKFDDDDDDECTKKKDITSLIAALARHYEAAADEGGIRCHGISKVLSALKLPSCTHQVNMQVIDTMIAQLKGEDWVHAWKEYGRGDRVHVHAGQEKQQRLVAALLLTKHRKAMRVSTSDVLAIAKRLQDLKFCKSESESVMAKDALLAHVDTIAKSTEVDSAMSLVEACRTTEDEAGLTKAAEALVSVLHNRQAGAKRPRGANKRQRAV
jgi:hypothetical protein